MNKQDVELLIARQAEAWQQADPAAIASDFAVDAHFISPGGAWQGPEAIAATAQAFFATVSAVKVEIKRVLLDGDQGAVEWVWHETRRADNQTYTMEDAIIFELRDDKIIYWREYFNLI